MSEPYSTGMAPGPAKHIHANNYASCFFGVFQHGLQYGYLSLSFHVKGGLFHLGMRSRSRRNVLLAAGAGSGAVKNRAAPALKTDKFWKNILTEF